ncbi:MAG: hypothetical protein M5U28_40480 [Sandaracinaceae bacterium]|nr:hypothetical protein [Sandaracinaceae bacterium]
MRAADVEVPEGFTVEAVMGFTVGLLGLVDYRPPSPLAYRELVWMPARVRARRADGRTARGYFVAKMYVDHEDRWRRAGRCGRSRSSSRASRSTSTPRAWSARTAPSSSSASAARGPACRRRARSSPCRRARASSCASAATREAPSRRGGVRVLSARDLDGTWRSFERARPLGPLGVELRDFETTMQPPVILAR